MQDAESRIEEAEDGLRMDREELKQRLKLVIVDGLRLEEMRAKADIMVHAPSRRSR